MLTTIRIIIFQRLSNRFICIISCVRTYFIFVLSESLKIFGNIILGDKTPYVKGVEILSDTNNFTRLGIVVTDLK